MELYTSIKEWLKENPSEDKNEKILSIINKKNRTQLKRELAKKQKELETLINEITSLEKQVGQIELKSR